MKIRISLKDPDAMYEAVAEAIKKDCSTLVNLTANERAEIAEARAEEIASEIGNRWMPYKEYLTFEVDTDTWTATILPVKDFK